MPCGGPKKSPRRSYIVQFILSFWSFEISEAILRNQKLVGFLFAITAACVVPCGGPKKSPQKKNIPLAMKSKQKPYPSMVFSKYMYI